MPSCMLNQAELCQSDHTHSIHSPPKSSTALVIVVPHFPLSLPLSPPFPPQPPQPPSSLCRWWSRARARGWGSWWLTQQWQWGRRWWWWAARGCVSGGHLCGDRGWWGAHADHQTIHSIRLTCPLYHTEHLQCRLSPPTRGPDSHPPHPPTPWAVSSPCPNAPTPHQCNQPCPNLQPSHYLYLSLSLSPSPVRQ